MTTTTQDQDKIIPWEDFSMETAEKESAKKKFALIKPGLYEIELTNLYMEMSMNNFTGQEEPQIVWHWKVVKNTADPTGTVYGDDNTIMQNPTLRTWSKPHQVGIWKGQTQLTRMIVVALLDLPVNAEIPGGVFSSAIAEELLTKRCQAFIEIVPKQDGTNRQDCRKFIALPKTSQIVHEQ